MIIQAEQSSLTGQVNIPASKSHTIRAVTIASHAAGKSYIRNPLLSSDAISAATCYRALGADVDTSDPDCWIINGFGSNPLVQEANIDVGNSGTTMRLALGSASLCSSNAEIHLTGDRQIQSRPVGPLIGSLNDLGANVKSLNNNECPPVKVSGCVKGGKTSIECFTSQYLSSLLLCCPLACENTEIIVPLLNEPDYVQITLDWLKWQNIQYENDEMSRFNIQGRQEYKPFNMSIPADFSSATFFLCAGALIGDNVTIKGLDFSDSQPDKAVVDYLKNMGADITIDKEGVHVRKSELKGIEIDMNRTPDALPAMAVTAAFASGTTRLVNVPQARKKETDRIACMAKELSKIGANIEELDDGLIICESSNLKPALIHGWGDHRIVMAMTVAGLVMDGKTTIDTAEAMDITFPQFVPFMKTLNGKVAISDKN